MERASSNYINDKKLIFITFYKIKSLISKHFQHWLFILKNLNISEGSV